MTVPVKRGGAWYADGVLIVNKSYPLDPSFGGGLTPETESAFRAMAKDACTLGLELENNNGFRPYDYQKKIYMQYCEEDGQALADTYSARPGHSEHQSGLCFDLNSISDEFADTPEGRWVDENCRKYGLIIRFPKGKESFTGYKYEPWHLRYVGDALAEKLYNNGDWMTLEEWFSLPSSYDDIK